eukprot:jgi/Ulvmu1/9068/UM005_0161.1
MADTVRGIMEAQVPELEDYERRGYFSRGEISSIVQTRQKFEYSLRRRNAKKSDFLRYYDYEWRLEQLRQLRRKQRAIAGKRSLADYGIVRRIHFIFDRATRKFKGDPGIWMSWLKFCKDSQSKRQVSKVITKALKLHPTAPYFWAYAAAWEFEGNANPASARQLLQSGLRNCPTKGSLWVEYFRMELMYANKVTARRKALGIDGDAEGEEEAEANAGQTAADAAIQQGKLAAVVYRSAVKRLPQDAVMRMAMLKAAAEVTCAGSAALQEEIVNTFIEDLGQDPTACGHLADSIRSGKAPPFPGGTEATCHFWHGRVHATQDRHIQRAAMRWMAERLNAVDAEVAARADRAGAAVLNSAWGPGEGAGTDAAAERAEHDAAGAVADCDQECEVLLEYMQQCSNVAAAGQDDAEVHALYAQALLRCGKSRQAVTWLQRSLRLCPGSEELWRMALRVCAACAAAGEPQHLGHASAEALVQTALRAAPPGCVSGAALPALALLRGVGQPVAVVLEHVVGRLATAAVGDVGQDVAAVLKAVWLGDGAEAGNSFAQKVAGMPRPGVDFWASYAGLMCSECMQTQPSSSVSIQAVNRVFERGVQAHGRDAVDLWLQWVEFMRESQQDTAAVASRAVKTLLPEHADEFSLRLHAQLG